MRAHRHVPAAHQSRVVRLRARRRHLQAREAQPFRELKLRVLHALLHRVSQPVPFGHGARHLQHVQRDVRSLDPRHRALQVAHLAVPPLHLVRRVARVPELVVAVAVEELVHQRDAVVDGVVDEIREGFHLVELRFARLVRRAAVVLHDGYRDERAHEVPSLRLLLELSQRHSRLADYRHLGANLLALDLLDADEGGDLVHPQAAVVRLVLRGGQEGDVREQPAGLVRHLVEQREEPRLVQVEHLRAAREQDLLRGEEHGGQLLGHQRNLLVLLERAGVVSLLGLEVAVVRGGLGSVAGGAPIHSPAHPRAAPPAGASPRPRADPTGRARGGHARNQRDGRGRGHHLAVSGRSGLEGK